MPVDELLQLASQAPVLQGQTLKVLSKFPSCIVVLLLSFNPLAAFILILAYNTYSFYYSSL